MNNIKKYGVRIVFIVLILISLTCIALAVGFKDVFMETVFQTGEVKIDLNEGEPIFDDNALDIEPNKKVIADFTVKNIGEVDCYYKVYLENIDGKIADNVVFDIYDSKNNLIKTVNVIDFTSANSIDLKTILTPQEEVSFTINAYLPSDSGNAYQTGKITFDVVAEGIQSKNR